VRRLKARVLSAPAEAIIVQLVFTGYQDRLVDLAMRVQLPIISDFPVFAKAGALFTFGVVESAVVQRTAYFVDRILKGAKAAELPVEQPTKFNLLTNLRTAKALNISVPAVLLSRADEVIE
jgi:putative ABC transport system substrate-binding protein